MIIFQMINIIDTKIPFCSLMDDLNSPFLFLLLKISTDEHETHSTVGDISATEYQ